MSDILLPPLILGDIRIDRIVELTEPVFPVREFFPDLTHDLEAEFIPPLVPQFVSADHKVILCFQSYLVRMPGRTILVDSCIGNHKPRPKRPFFNMLDGARWPKTLAALGLTMADIDMVMCTHLHVDHVGWNTKLENGRWVPAFPNARYLFSQTELDFWTAREKEAPQFCPWITDSVLPVVAAGQCDCVPSDHALDENLRLIPTPGHTIDHFSVELGGREPDAIIGGDMVHSPLQMMFPDLGMFSDYDSAQAGRTRRDLFSRIASAPTRLCTAHFPGQSIIQVTGEKDGGFEWAPAF